MTNPDYLISTPENVDLHLELAGLGNRILAAAIDTALSWVMIGLTIMICVGAGLAIENSPIPRDNKTIIYYYIAGIGLFIAFFILAGYFIYFEGTWHGQTPGKRLANIRVIESNGQPVTWASVLIRNLLRLVDQSFFMIGVLPMIIDKNERRFGDLAAGTLVIKETIPQLGADTINVSVPRNIGEFADVGQLTPDEYYMLLTYLKRRDSLDAGQRPLLARDLSNYFKERLSLTETGETPEQLLEKIFVAYSNREQLAQE